MAQVIIFCYKFLRVRVRCCNILLANFSKYQTLDLHLEQSVAEKWKILLHSQDSLNDALYIHPNFQITSSRYKSKQFMIRSKRMSKTSTRPRPCQKYWPKACHEMYLHKKIKNEYNCTIPILDSGIHFQQGNLGGIQQLRGQNFAIS